MVTHSASLKKPSPSSSVQTFSVEHAVGDVPLLLLLAAREREQPQQRRDGQDPVHSV
jgi:hypothetical protein